MSKRLGINLNKQERLIINDVCTILGVTDRSKVVKELAMAKASEWLKQIAEQRMAKREEMMSERNNGEAERNSTETRDSTDTDSTVQADQKNNMDDSGRG